LELIRTVLIAVFVFGFLIFIHEFGHYIFARIFKVTITEFSIGMGPKLVWYDSKKTGIRYALSAIPIGGYVAMVGEDSESDDPNAFNKKPCWQRLIITVAGAAVNIIAGILAIIIIASVTNIGSTTVAAFPETEYIVSSEDSGLMVGDTILRVDGKRVNMLDQLSYEIMRRGHEPVDLVVLRDGAEVTLEDVRFPTDEEQGQIFGMMDFQVYRVEKNVFKVLGYSFSKAFLIVRMCWESIIDLMTGRYTMAAVSGPVGISEVIGTAANQGALSLLNITALISMNLGIMNLLPLPALDGGRTIMILYEMITRKKIPSNIESTINAVGLMVLLGLSVIIMIKDIFGLFA
jgi:regulator of sigma E protease